jgi:ribosomal protein S18 acetylase RimI-like enzyme
LPVPEPARLEGLPEAERNAQLRRLDWRFLLRMPDGPGDADLAVMKRARQGELADAYNALRSGGEVHLTRRLPIPGASRRARLALERAGFVDVRVHWPWPPAVRASPQFWTPVEEPAAADHLLRARPPTDRRRAVGRRLWRIAAAIGALAPLSVIGRKPGGPATGGEEIEAALDRIPGHAGAPRSWLLLTGGKRSINKVVGLAFAAGSRRPRCVVKFARVAAAEAGLEHEAATLEAIEAERPELPGVPRLLTRGRRVGRLAIAETAIEGTPMLATLTPPAFPELAEKLTEWLIQLAGSGPPLPRSRWWGRLVAEPLADFEQGFGHAVEIDVSAIRELLEELPDLPVVCEHRDCSPWNVLLTHDGEPALLDWESSEPCGLPGLDLVYFLANAAFVIEGVLESGRTLEAYAHLLDAETATGRVFAECVSRYCDRLGLSPESLVALRSLCWIVHSRSDRRHLEMDAGAPPSPAALQGSTYLGLLREDLMRWKALR